MRRKLDDKSQKCILVGYSEEYKEYRLYNPITKKYVINIDVLLKEEKSWDGRIYKLVVEDTVTPHAKYKEDEQGIHGGQLTSHTPTVRTPVKTPRTHERGEPSSVGGQKGKISQVSNESNPTLASLKNRVKGQKIRSLRELYEQNEDSRSSFNFCIYSMRSCRFWLLKGMFGIKTIYE